MKSKELFRRRLVFTVGKGGVGRTTVTMALALEAARQGLDVLLVELEGARGLGAALEAQRHAQSPPPGIERLSYLTVDGKRALEEYLSLIIPVRRLLRTIFSSKIYQYFVAAAPGLKELMTVGKIWFEAYKSQDQEPSRPHPDLVLIDAPATGHSLQYLRMPQAALETFPTGLVHREAERIVAVLADPAATAVVIVTTAEEMPTNETIDIHRGLRAIGLPTTLLVVNQVHRAPCTQRELEAAEGALASLGAAPGKADREILGEVVARARDERGWAEINAANIARLAAEVPIQTVALPMLFTEEFSPEHVVQLSAELARQLDLQAVAPRPVAERSRRVRG